MTDKGWRSLIAVLAVWVLVPTVAWAGWTQGDRLMALDGEEGDLFGCAVVMRGDLAVVSAPDDDEGMGAAYLFRSGVDGWLEIAKLTASDAQVGDDFGVAVAFDRDTVLIGAPTSPEIGGLGAIYVFERPELGWSDMTETAKLAAPTRTRGSRFGQALAVDRGWAVVGAPGDSSGSRKGGSAWLFERTDAGWLSRARLAGTDTVRHDCLGSSVAIEGDIVLAGNPCDEMLGAARGSAYVFRRPVGGWTDMTESARLVPDDLAFRFAAQFGWSVDVEGELAAIGAPAAGATASIGSVFDPAVLGGAVYVYDLERSTRLVRLTLTDAAPGDSLGHSVVLTGRFLASGAVGAAAQGESSGAAYIFERRGEIWSSGIHLDSRPLYSGSELGCSVSVDRGRVLVGALRAVGMVPGSGSAYLFQLGGGGSSVLEPDTSGTYSVE